MEVFESTKVVKIDENELTIHLATFVEGEKLLTETLKCNKDGLFGIDSLQSESFKLALLPCLKKAFWNKEPINDWSFFEDVNKRVFYLDICLAVMDFNLLPFTSRLLSSLKQDSQETE